MFTTSEFRTNAPATCGASGFPICVGEKAYLLVLIASTAYKAYSTDAHLSHDVMQCTLRSPDSAFNVIGYPMLATYNDNEHYTLANNTDDEFITRAINNIISVNTPPHDNSNPSYYGFYGVESVESFAKINEMVRHNSLRVKDNNIDTFVSFMPIRADIFDLVVKSESLKSLFSAEHITRETFLEELNYAVDCGWGVKESTDIEKYKNISVPSNDTLERIAYHFILESNAMLYQAIANSEHVSEQLKNGFVDYHSVKSWFTFNNKLFAPTMYGMQHKNLSDAIETHKKMIAVIESTYAK